MFEKNVFNRLENSHLDIWSFRHIVLMTEKLNTFITQNKLLNSKQFSNWLVSHADLTNWPRNDHFSLKDRAQAKYNTKKNKFIGSSDPRKFSIPNYQNYNVKLKIEKDTSNKMQDANGNREY